MRDSGTVQETKLLTTVSNCEMKEQIPLGEGAGSLTFKIKMAVNESEGKQMGKLERVQIKSYNETVELIGSSLT